MTNYWTDQMDLDTARKTLGGDFIDNYVALQPNPVSHCLCRAAGAWDANEPETYAAYHALAYHFRNDRNT